MTVYVHCTAIYYNCTVYFLQCYHVLHVYLHHMYSHPHPSQISGALDKVGVVSAVAPLIPDLVARLHTLKDLHERAAQFAGIMDDSQEKLTNQISDLQSLLTTVAHNKSCLIMICYCRFRAHSKATCPQSSQSSAD